MASIKTKSTLLAPESPSYASQGLWGVDQPSYANAKKQRAFHGSGPAADKLQKRAVARQVWRFEANLPCLSQPCAVFRALRTLPRTDQLPLSQNCLQHPFQYRFQYHPQCQVQHHSQHHFQQGNHLHSHHRRRTSLGYCHLHRQTLAFP